MMSVVVLDESRKRCAQLADALEKSKRPVACCRNSNEFMTKISGGLPDRIVMDVESWTKGRTIYAYFDIAKKIAEVPIVFYNAPENFATIEDRSKHGQDEILPAPTPVEQVAELVRKLM
jgi:DNA-binding NtrC family response regulator